MRVGPPPPEPDRGRPSRVVFLDKDGTLIVDVPYNVDPALLHFRPGAADALARLAADGYQLIVISNQPGVALGRFEWRALEALVAALTARLEHEGVQLAGFYACPHAPTDRASRWQCSCRKPAAGLFFEAAREHAIDLGRSWMIGDILDDIEAGRRAGCGSVLLDVGNETEWRWSHLRVPDFRVPNLLAAAESILSTPLSRCIPLEAHA
jgi:D-glycero-D-manno-heptose 1,7-bisphosphate phosphatase